MMTTLLGKPMQKSDFFHVENNRVVPYVLFNEPIGLGQHAKIRPYHGHLRKTVHKYNISSHSCTGFE